MRIKRGNVCRNRHKKILKLAKGFKGARSRIFKGKLASKMFFIFPNSSSFITILVYHKHYFEFRLKKT